MVGADSMFIYDFMILSMLDKMAFATTDKLMYNYLLIHGLDFSCGFYNFIYLSETIVA